MTNAIKPSLLSMLGIPAALLSQANSSPSDFALRNARIIASLHATKPVDSAESATWHKRQRNSIQGGQYCMADVAIFLEKVYSLSSVNEHKAVDEVYDFIDECLLDGDFSLCEAALNSAAPGKMSLSAAISLLIVTRRAKPRLPAREAFFTRALNALSNRPSAMADALALRKYR